MFKTNNVLILIVCITSHKRHINEMCSTLINLCIFDSAQTIPRGRPPIKQFHDEINKLKVSRYIIILALYLAEGS